MKQSTPINKLIKILSLPSLDNQSQHPFVCNNAEKIHLRLYNKLSTFVDINMGQESIFRSLRDD